MSSQFIADLMTSRREALGSIAAVMAAGAVATSQAAEPKKTKGGLDFNDPRDNLYAFGKIVSGYEKPVVGGFHGIQYARIGNQRLIPVFGFAGVGVSMAEFDAKEGKLRRKSRETAYFTDLRTGEVLEQWHNPFTEETVDVYHFYNPSLAGVSGIEMPPLLMGQAGDAPTFFNQGSVFPDENGKIPFKMPFIQVGDDDILMSWDYTHDYTNPVDAAGWPKASVGARATPSEHFTYYVSKRELEDRSLPTARARAGFSRQGNWWPWMKMGASKYRDGVLTGRMFSHNGLDGFQDVHPKVLKYMEKHAPQYLEPPPDFTIRTDRMDVQKAYVQDIPPEVAGYEWKQKRKSDIDKPPTGAGARV
ncbi:MAG: DUF1838 family protein [Rhodospirillaceae bacterium]|nr:DUF1838 family protein [Rhodospirillaceae bacterium]